MGVGHRQTTIADSTWVLGVVNPHSEALLECRAPSNHIQSLCLSVGDLVEIKDPNLSAKSHTLSRHRRPSRRHPNRHRPSHRRRRAGVLVRELVKGLGLVGVREPTD